ncbi:hypothetical protein CN692_06760 [Bacillus sp. AFS002410]|nr:hypothetical protein CN692_06760 [Bacillus sp. AFS002410]
MLTFSDLESGRLKKLQSNSRTTSRAKKRKTKLFILSGSIAVVIIVIVFVSNSILSSGDKKPSPLIDDYASAGKQSDNNIKNDKQEADTSSDDNSSQDQTQTDESNDNTSSTEDSSETIAPETPEQTGVTPETPEQTGGQHVTSYDSSSQDWQNMLQTIATATGLDRSNMTVWFLGSDKSNKGGSVGTVSSKEKGSQKYRVYLQWNGSGYIATKVEPAS